MGSEPWHPWMPFVGFLCGREDDDCLLRICGRPSRPPRAEGAPAVTVEAAPVAVHQTTADEGSPVGGLVRVAALAPPVLAQEKATFAAAPGNTGCGGLPPEKNWGYGRLPGLLGQLFQAGTHLATLRYGALDGRLGRGVVDIVDGDMDLELLLPGSAFPDRRDLGLLKLGAFEAIRVAAGRRVTVDADVNEEVGTLKRRAQIALGVGRGRLVGSSGSVLDAWTPIKRARLQNGDLLALHINRVQVQASSEAFAAILGDGSVVTWGRTNLDGDSGAVQDQLKNVQQIQATSGAFAAILDDGSVVTWGLSAYGGDSSTVRGQLKNVQQIQASAFAFAAVLRDGCIVTWGRATHGGDSSAVQGQLKNVRQIQASHFAFAAVLGEGSVVTWGLSGHGGDSSAVQDHLKNVQQIQATSGAFAAILDDGSVVTWGLSAYGGDSSTVRGQLKNVQQIQASDSAFAAVLGDGSIVTWGSADSGGDSSAVYDLLQPE
ncbi:hypothetical protein AK812_SmicGene16390 [Symbiodinium microadriaticum]|uniref:E3 ubiquitin-protein ligase HERC2 n=1 Tax=Symbiodinium microadriaticum TaxID=2951 RepID=A0A1Q9E0F7_SYMMI|nr:hypothetical protein AK812_SmicGene16390 [Symbiodinium microadriaticum]